MKTHCIERIQRLPIGLDQAWAFFSNPANLPLITPPWLNFTITSRVPATIYPGLILTYRLSPAAGFAIPWVSEITHARAPRYFVDEQRSGPYRFWHHQHHLAAAPGGVQVIDTVHYSLPLGIFGLALHALWVKRRLDEIFSFRYHALDQLFR
ncbi:MAG: SRPBCC family protein [Desulfobacterales bacterium]|jgi:ligand-binding SRPBCC domain-containing protein